MTPSDRLSYLDHLRIDRDSIPGRALLNGQWDTAPAFLRMVEEARPKGLTEMVDE